MSVIKRKRKESQFEVFHNMTKMRQEVTDLLLRDFGYKPDKVMAKINKRFGNREYEELSQSEKIQYDNLVQRETAFAGWFITDERQTVVDCLRDINKEAYLANSIYPTSTEELIERRLHQELAIGHCYRLVQELQYVVETLPVDINKYLRFADMIDTQISLLKGWRKSDNKLKRAISDNAANFANVNNNGNANYNNAGNSNGVRPDFDAAIKSQLSVSQTEKGETVLPNGKY